MVFSDTPTRALHVASLSAACSGPDIAAVFSKCVCAGLGAPSTPLPISFAVSVLLYSLFMFISLSWTPPALASPCGRCRGPARDPADARRRCCCRRCCCHYQACLASSPLLSLPELFPLRSFLLQFGTHQRHPTGACNTRQQRRRRPVRRSLLRFRCPGGRGAVGERPAWGEEGTGASPGGECMRRQQLACQHKMRVGRSLT